MTVPYQVFIANNNIEIGQVDLTFLPKWGHHGRRGVVLIHGAGGNARYYNDSHLPGNLPLAATIAGMGLVCVAAYDAGNSWDNVAMEGTGNNDGLLDANFARLKSLGCASDKFLIVGTSMGGLQGLTYMAVNPNKVAAYVGLIPANDENDLRDNNRLGVRADINIAHSLPVGSTSSTVPLPINANPSTSINAAKIAACSAVKKIYYSTVDTIVLPSTILHIAPLIGAETIVIDTTYGHSDLTIAQAPFGEIANFLNDNSIPSRTSLPHLLPARLGG